jgi:RNA polymerase subunit RPABC4/transcription elongation factor Spt4
MREQVRTRLEAGMPVGEIARELGIAAATVCYHARRLGYMKEDRCEVCGLRDWRGRPITLALHQVNGVGDDNRLENLAILCPNCHSQTENFGGRNVRVA